jgi:hypothetical protein
MKRARSSSVLFMNGGSHPRHLPDRQSKRCARVALFLMVDFSTTQCAIRARASCFVTMPAACCKTA